MKNHSCKLCDYKTNKLSDYNKHLLTRKHKFNEKENKFNEKENKFDEKKNKFDASYEKICDDLFQFLQINSIIKLNSNLGLIFENYKGLIFDRNKIFNMLKNKIINMTEEINDVIGYLYVLYNKMYDNYG